MTTPASRVTAEKSASRVSDARVTCENSEVGHLYYIELAGRTAPPYTQQRHVNAILDIASDGTLAGIELIDDMPPPPLSSDNVSDGSKGGRVKPLEWKENLGRGGGYIYEISEPNRTPGWRVWVRPNMGMQSVIGGGIVTVKAKDRDEAIAVAEADYRFRILTALDSGTGGQQPVAWAGLSIATEKLVDDFASALKTKLRAAELKYGYDDGWKGDDWETKCRRDLLRHVMKGDPLDVAAYAAFSWHHQWPTTPTPLDVAHFQLVALPPLFSSPTEPKAGVVSEDMVDMAITTYCATESNDMRDMMRAALAAAIDGGKPTDGH